jgi:histidine ammonia-lyase
MNLEKILAIELMNASQAMDFRRPTKSSSKLEQLISDYRKVVPFVDKDRVLFTDIKNSIEFLRTYNFETIID